MRGVSVAGCGREIALAHLHFYAFAAVDGDVSEGAVLLGIRGCVGGDVLGALFVGDLFKRVIELLAVGANVDETAASLF